MKNNRRKRAAFEAPSYWQSFSDMMAALLLIFILIIAITLMIYKQKTTDLERTQNELNAAQIELEQFRKEIEASNRELAASLTELQIACKTYKHTCFVEIISKFVLQNFCHCFCCGIDSFFDINIRGYCVDAFIIFQTWFFYGNTF